MTSLFLIDFLYKNQTQGSVLVIWDGSHDYLSIKDPL